LIAIGGPPLGGKSVLLARLAESLAFAVRIEAIDDLSHAEPIWYPEGSGGKRIRKPTRALLQTAVALWEAREPGSAPILLVSSRFAKRDERRRAQRTARALGVRFLFVEARSRNIRALRRIPMHRLSREELALRLERYQAALRAYVPVDAAEARSLPAVRLSRVQSRLEESLARVLRAWDG
jgi:hypothetical protein